MKPRLVLVDNYDSFTWNLVQYLGELGADVRVFRNDAIDVAGIRGLRPRGLVISPGPCTPDEAGVSLEAIRALAGAMPILGVCLGHQAIGQAFGGKVVRNERIVHGKASPVLHRGDGIYAGLPSPFEYARIGLLPVMMTCPGRRHTAARLVSITSNFQKNVRCSLIASTILSR